MAESVDLAIVGAGAAGLMAAIQAGRAAPGLRIAALDGARTLGAKILVAGGGRCNVTHHEVTADDFAGSTRPAIAKVLRRFEVADVVRFFHTEGVELKREPTGKLFPTTDRARTVPRCSTRHARPSSSTRGGWRRSCRIPANTVCAATGGRWGRAGWSSRREARRCRAAARTARATSRPRLGHSTTATIFPSLVPLFVPEDRLAAHRLRRRRPGTDRGAERCTGKRLATFEGDSSALHFGMSGPVVLDASHFLAARQADPAAKLVVAFLPTPTPTT
ncbi:MAG: NAD(P)/FAD-dependent oxidoreductase [Thermoanaerobaculia bacterium]